MPTETTDVFFSNSLAIIIKRKNCLEHDKESDSKTPEIDLLSKIHFFVNDFRATVRRRTAKCLIENILILFNIFG